MDTQIITIDDNVRHKIKLLNGNAPMNISELKDKRALCDHYEPNEEGGTTHKKSWFPVEELNKIDYSGTA